MDQNPNVAVIQKTYAAFNRADVDATLANIDPNARWVNFGPAEVPYFGDFTGRITEFFRGIGESTMNGQVAAQTFTSSGDTVVAAGRYTATVRSNGSGIDVPIAHIFTVRDGKITSWTGYSDSAAVMAAHTGRAVTAA